MIKVRASLLALCVGRALVERVDCTEQLRDARHLLLAFVVVGRVCNFVARGSRCRVGRCSVEALVEDCVLELLLESRVVYVVINRLKLLVLGQVLDHRGVGRFSVG